jgi:hypothetical protein
MRKARRDRGRVEEVVARATARAAVAAPIADIVPLTHAAADREFEKMSRWRARSDAMQERHRMLGEEIQKQVGDSRQSTAQNI